IYFLGGPTTAAPTTTLHSPHITVHPIAKTSVSSPPIQSQPANAAGQPVNAAGQPDSGTTAKTPVAENLHARIPAQQPPRGVRQLSAPLMGEGSRFRFDPQQVIVRQESERWRLVNGNFVLADFGADATQAQRVLQLIRNYGCDEECWIGKAAPTF